MRRRASNVDNKKKIAVWDRLMKACMIAPPGDNPLKKILRLAVKILMESRKCISIEKMGLCCSLA